MNMFPLRLSPGLPILAEDMRKVRESWKLLVDAGAETDLSCAWEAVFG